MRISQSIYVDVLKAIGEALHTEKDAEIQKHDSDICPVGSKESVNALLETLTKKVFAAISDGAGHNHVDHVKATHTALKFALK